MEKLRIRRRGEVLVIAAACITIVSHEAARVHDRGE